MRHQSYLRTYINDILIKPFEKESKQSAVQRRARHISSSPKQWWWPLSHEDCKRGTVQFRKPIYEPKICYGKKKSPMHHQKCFEFPSNSPVPRNDFSWLRMHFVMKTGRWFCRIAIGGVIMANWEPLNFFIFIAWVRWDNCILLYKDLYTFYIALLVNWHLMSHWIFEYIFGRGSVLTYN